MRLSRTTSCALLVLTAFMALVTGACDRSARPSADASPPQAATVPDAGHVVHARVVVDLAQSDALEVSRTQILEALSGSGVTVIGLHETKQDKHHGGGRTLTLDIGNADASVEKIGSVVIHIAHRDVSYLRDIATVEMATPP